MTSRIFILEDPTPNKL